MDEIEIDRKIAAKSFGPRIACGGRIYAPLNRADPVYCTVCGAKEGQEMPFYCQRVMKKSVDRVKKRLTNSKKSV